MLNNRQIQRIEALGLYGLRSHWEEIQDTPWLESVLQWEETSRSERGLARRLQNAKFEKFKSLAHFDWTWPNKCDRSLIEKLMQLDFLQDATNIILCGPNGVGKTMIAHNLGYQSVLRGHTVLFTTAANMLKALIAQTSDRALGFKINGYVKPDLLIIDEVGYLSYCNRHADLLFEVVSKRYEKKSTLITTNKPFTEWNTIFPNAACVVSIVDRLVHHSEILVFEAKSYRVKEAQEKLQSKQAITEVNKKKRPSQSPVIEPCSEQALSGSGMESQVPLCVTI